MRSAPRLSAILGISMALNGCADRTPPATSPTQAGGIVADAGSRVEIETKPDVITISPNRGVVDETPICLNINRVRNACSYDHDRDGIVTTRLTSCDPITAASDIQKILDAYSNCAKELIPCLQAAPENVGGNDSRTRELYDYAKREDFMYRVAASVARNYDGLGCDMNNPDFFPQIQRFGLDAVEEHKAIMKAAHDLDIKQGELRRNDSQSI